MLLMGKPSISTGTIFIHLYHGKLLISHNQRLSPHRRTLGDFDVKMTVKPGVISIVPEVRRKRGSRGERVRNDSAPDVQCNVWLNDT